MKKIIRFLSDLQQNNNREWFNANKTEYQECKACFDEFTEQLIAGIREFDDSIGPLTARDCTYRIYRDVRFSQDKSPYKTHFGAFVVPRGKKSGYSGYYFQVGANDEGFPGGCMLATGNYCFEPKVLRTLREDILTDEDNLFASALATARDFTLDFSDALKRIPQGFPADHPNSDFLRLKSFCLLKSPGRAYMQRPDLLQRALSDFKTTVPFLHFINRAVEYVKES